METKGETEEMKVTLLPHRILTSYPPRSKHFYSGMPSTGSRPPIFEQPQPDCFEEAVIFQRFYDELRAAPGDVSAEDAILQRLYDELSVSVDGSVPLKNTPRLQFPSANLGKVSAVDSPDPAGQVGITTGYPKSNDSSVVPIREVAALKIDEN